MEDVTLSDTMDGEQGGHLEAIEDESNDDGQQDVLVSAQEVQPEVMGTATTLPAMQIGGAATPATLPGGATVSTVQETLQTEPQMLVVASGMASDADIAEYARDGANIDGGLVAHQSARSPKGGKLQARTSSEAMLGANQDVERALVAPDPSAPLQDDELEVCTPITPSVMLQGVDAGAPLAHDELVAREQEMLSELPHGEEVNKGKLMASAHKGV